MVGRRRPPHARAAGPRRGGPAGDETGLALVTALMVVLLVGGALALLAAALDLRMRAVRQEARTVRVTALADAAVAATVAELARSWSYPGLAEERYGGGTIASEVRWLDGRTSEVVARATWGGVERVVRVIVTRTPSGLRVSGWRRLAGDEHAGV
jgi:hypothetical protein